MQDVATAGTFLDDVEGKKVLVFAQDNAFGHYFATAPDKDVNAAMVEAVEAAGSEADLFTPDGFVAAQLVVEAISQGKGDVDAMIDALEGFSFTGPKGETTVRESDHALLDQQPGLYADPFLTELLQRLPSVRVREVPDVNHYTILLGDRGAAEVAAAVREELAAGRPAVPIP